MRWEPAGRTADVHLQGLYEQIPVLGFIEGTAMIDTKPPGPGQKS